MEATKKIIVVVVEARFEISPEDYPTEVGEILDRLRETGEAEIVDLIIKEPKR